jgi:hypothetical protein
MVKVVRRKKVEDDFYNYTEWGAISNGIVWATIYQGYGPSRRSIYNRTWCYVVKYVDNSQEDYKYEHYKTFREAKKRAIEIVEAEIKKV